MEAAVQNRIFHSKLNHVFNWGVNFLEKTKTKRLQVLCNTYLQKYSHAGPLLNMFIEYSEILSINKVIKFSE